MTIEFYDGGYMECNTIEFLDGGVLVVDDYRIVDSIEVLRIRG